MPYRRDAGSTSDAPSGDAGIIDDLVQQFAEPFACLRELVQNSIDAEATTIRVRIRQDGDVAIVAVRDDGEGMDQDILENQLFVLFRSSKEGLADKIGKFGVGFVSVFALAPTEVKVTTSPGAGRSWTGVLTQDHEYSIFEQPGGEGSGTTVTLTVPLRDEFHAFVSRAHASLVRWCRHSTTPIEFHVQSGQTSALDGGHDRRIDRPLDLPGAWCVVDEERGPCRVLVGISESTSASFYSRGLTLYEAPMMRPVHELAFKVSDPRLEHTMSRDDVRRDAYFDEALAFVQEVARSRLLPRMVEVLDGMEPADFATHVASARRLEESLGVETSRVRFARVQGGRSALVDGAMHAPEASALTRALESAGVPVFCSSGLLSHFFRRVLGPPVHESHAWLEVVDPTPHDALMLDAFAESLNCVARRPPMVHLVRVEGCVRERVFIASKPGLFTKGDDKPPFRRLFRPPILINIGAHLVATARERAEMWPEVAGAVLARAALRAFDAWDLDADARWVEHALETLE